MSKKIIMPQQYLDIEDITTLFETLNQAFNVHTMLYLFGKKMAAKYWENIVVPELIPPRDILKGILHNLTISNNSKEIYFEEDAREIRIILENFQEPEDENGICDFFAGFIEELVSNAFQIHSKPAMKFNENNKCAVTFKKIGGFGKGGRNVNI